MAQWLTLMPRNREAAGSNLSGVFLLGKPGFSPKGAYYEVGYCGKKTFLAGLQCTLTSSCAKTEIGSSQMILSENVFRKIMRTKISKQ